MLNHCDKIRDSLEWKIVDVWSGSPKLGLVGAALPLEEFRLVI
jgi:hypothetical protein